MAIPVIPVPKARHRAHPRAVQSAEDAFYARHGGAGPRILRRVLDVLDGPAGARRCDRKDRG